ncbi:hypothetical protein VM98_35030, partial [Streptomyces rubellomurinus subsp. indigoferus]
MGGCVDGTWPRGGYGCGNRRGRVGFVRAIGALIEDGAGCVLGVSARPVLAMAVVNAVAGRGAGARVGVLESLRRDEGGFERFASALSEAHVAGVSVDWSAVFAGTGDVGLGQRGGEPLEA